jgi:hypothetical protein
MATWPSVLIVYEDTLYYMSHMYTAAHLGVLSNYLLPAGLVHRLEATNVIGVPLAPYACAM